MTLGGFILGTVIMLVGFLLVYRTNWFIENFGDVGEILGIDNATWASWKFLGVGFMVVGFLIAFGLVQLFLRETLGQFFLIGGF